MAIASKYDPNKAYECPKCKGLSELQRIAVLFAVCTLSWAVVKNL